MKKEHFILNEKYRPDTLDGYLGEDSFKAKVKEYISKQDLPHLLLVGKAGSGKTTLAKILVKNIDCDFLYLNATDERSMEVMRDKVKSFASSASFKPLKIVILDEATHILVASQVLLLNMMETFSLNTRFILTGNYVERLIEPLRSRCAEFKLEPPSKKAVARHIINILNKEDIEFNIENVAEVINSSYPDLRKTINNIQKCIKGKELILDQSLTKTNDFVTKIIDELKKPSFSSFTNIRQIIADNEVGDFTELYSALYKHASEYASNREGSVAIILEEYMYHANFRVDQEINVMACIAKILDLINKKQIIK